MQREARSGTRLDGPTNRPPRTITKICGLHLWSTVLRVSRSPHGPVVELRQRPWTAVIGPVACLLILAAGLAVGFVEYPNAGYAVGLALLAGFGAWYRYGSIRVGPEGMTLQAGRSHPREVVPWKSVKLVRVAAEFPSRFYRTTVTIEVADQRSEPRVVRFSGLSRRRGRALGLVLLATCHRYGVPGVCLWDVGSLIWRWNVPPLARDERYLGTRTRSRTRDDAGPWPQP